MHANGAEWVEWSDVRSNRGIRGCKAGICMVFVGCKVVRAIKSRRASAQMKYADNMTDRSKTE